MRFGLTSLLSGTALIAVMCSTALSKDMNYLGNWVNSKAYNVGSVVAYNMGIFYSLKDTRFAPNKNHVPDSSPTWWVQVGTVGNTVLNGVVNPTSPSLGQVGDFYINTATNTIFGPKTAISPFWPAAGVALGAAGASGSTGDAGATGETGATGTTGATGDTGPMGATGATGAKGDDGSIGPTGGIGLQGPVGANGVPGATGPQGVAGATGAAGATGPVGAMGPNGNPNIGFGASEPNIIGPTGATGPTGAPGDTGATGPTGAPGDTGATGAVFLTAGSKVTIKTGANGGGALVVASAGLYGSFTSVLCTLTYNYVAGTATPDAPSGFPTVLGTSQTTYSPNIVTGLALTSGLQADTDYTFQLFYYSAAAGVFNSCSIGDVKLMVVPQ